MRRALLLCLLLLATGCNKTHSDQYSITSVSGFGHTTRGKHHLTKVSSDFDDFCLLQPITIGLGGIINFGVPPTLKWTPIVVAVTDDLGELVDGVSVNFQGESNANGYLGPLGLGYSISGWAAGGFYPATHGHAATVAQPYALGPQHVTATCDGDQVTFVITGR